jgi:hypothetical protein
MERIYALRLLALITVGALALVVVFALLQVGYP